MGKKKKLRGAMDVRVTDLHLDPSGDVMVTASRADIGECTFYVKTGWRTPKLGQMIKVECTW